MTKRAARAEGIRHFMGRAFETHPGVDFDLKSLHFYTAAGYQRVCQEMGMSTPWTLPTKKEVAALLRSMRRVGTAQCKRVFYARGGHHYVWSLVEG